MIRGVRRYQIAKSEKLIQFHKWVAGILLGVISNDAKKVDYLEKETEAGNEIVDGFQLALQEVVKNFCKFFKRIGNLYQ